MECTASTRVPVRSRRRARTIDLQRPHSRKILPVCTILIQLARSARHAACVDVHLVLPSVWGSGKNPKQTKKETAPMGPLTASASLFSHPLDVVVVGVRRRPGGGGREQQRSNASHPDDDRHIYWPNENFRAAPALSQKGRPGDDGFLRARPNPRESNPWSTEEGESSWPDFDGLL